MSAYPKYVNAPSVPITWSGLSGSYTFELHTIGTLYRAIPGVYIFCRDVGQSKFSAIYVGETDNLERRLSSQLQAHHRYDAVLRHGATHLSTLHVPGGQLDRLRIETDLRQALNPPCNRQ